MTYVNLFVAWVLKFGMCVYKNHMSVCAYVMVRACMPHAHHASHTHMILSLSRNIMYQYVTIHIKKNVFNNTFTNVTYDAP